MKGTISDSINSNARKAELVIHAKVKSVALAPAMWSGLLVSYQQVEYETISYLKRPPGYKGMHTILVFHPVVARSVTADPETPKLRESIFKPGAELILFLRQQGPRLETFDEDYGAIPANHEALQLVTKDLEK